MLHALPPPDAAVSATLSASKALVVSVGMAIRGGLGLRLSVLDGFPPFQTLLLLLHFADYLWEENAEEKQPRANRRRRAMGARVRLALCIVAACLVGSAAPDDSDTGIRGGWVPAQVMLT